MTVRILCFKILNHGSYSIMLKIDYVKHFHIVRIQGITIWLKSMGDLCLAWVGMGSSFVAKQTYL